MKLHNKKAFYLCSAGKAKQMAMAYRATFHRLNRELFDVVHSLGATKACRCERMMKLKAVQFNNNTAPEGWVKLKQGINLYYPKKNHKDKVLLSHFTPSGCYEVKTHKELQPFFDWLKFPRVVHFKNELGGKHTVSTMFDGPLLHWFSNGGPILLVLADLEDIKKDAAASGFPIASDGTDWKPPKGLRKVTVEEWDYMEAKHKCKRV